MLVNESVWIGKALGDLKVGAISPLVNLGSATHAFRTKIQPHIHNHIILPLLERQVQVIHADLFGGDGVDVVGDIYDTAVFDSLVDYKPHAVLCSNMFEHVTDRERLADSLARMLPAGGILVVTVPHSFPYHPDPIDSYFRPNLDDLRSLLPGFEFVQGEIVECGTLVDRYRDNKKFMVSQVVGSVVPLPPGRWFRHLHHWLWLARPYRVSCAVFRKRATVPASRSNESDDAAGAQKTADRQRVTGE